MHCISISHKTSPIEIREHFSFTIEEKKNFEKSLLEYQNISGCVILSTCNRSELYFSGDKDSIDLVIKELALVKHINTSELLKYIHVYSMEGAITHLFRVTAGLESMVLGEDEILRQVKDAYGESLQNCCTNYEVNIIFQDAMSSAKAIKTDTDISKTPVSIGTLAANQVTEFLQGKEAATVLIVGATGKMGTIIVKNLYKKEQLKLIGTSRNHLPQMELVLNNKNFRMVPYGERYQYIDQADVIISATKSPHYTFTKQEVLKYIINKDKLRLFIDLAVPKDMDKEIGLLKGAELLDIDYFETASRENNIRKLKEMDKIEIVLEQRIDETRKTLYFQDFRPTMDTVIKKVEKIGLEHMMYRFKDALTSDQFKAVLDIMKDMEKGVK